MARLTSLTSKVLPALLATSVAAGLLAPTAASAKQMTISSCVLSGQCGSKAKVNYNPNINYGLLGKKPGSYKPGYGYGYGYKPGYGGGWGYGAAALAGGLALGAIAASAASASDGACFTERRRMVDDEGNVYVRRVRVCE